MSTEGYIDVGLLGEKHHKIIFIALESLSTSEGPPPFVDYFFHNLVDRIDPWWAKLVLFSKRSYIFLTLLLWMVKVVLFCA